MGASDFTIHVKGKTAKDAFNSAREDALYDYGHRGYTGTIAEKHSFVGVGRVKTAKEAITLAYKLIDEQDPRIDDKWGPAGCIEVEEDGSYVFFGWASS